MSTKSPVSTETNVSGGNKLSTEKDGPPVSVLANETAPELSETSASSSAGDRPPDELAVHTSVVLTSLAKQLEYYFSQQNLVTDTYVQTLRTLNDGCVPVSILANFAKVKAILMTAEEESRIHAVLQAAAEYSELLKVHSIDTTSGKIATDATPSSASTILALGTVDGQPIPPTLLRRSSSVASVSSLVSPGRASTIILRDVNPNVTEEEVRQLFDFEGCPAIESLYADVAYCWFVTLDTTSRDDMMKVMMHVRTQTLGGDYVQARLKASAMVIDEAAPALWPVLDEMALPGKKKKKKKRSKKNKKKSGGKQATPKNGNAVTKPEGTAPAPPKLGEEDFPTLQDTTVEWETPISVERDDDKNEDDSHGLHRSGNKSSISLSDAASTATTISSSLDSQMPKKALGGYAAALLKTTTTPSPTTITEVPATDPRQASKGMAPPVPKLSTSKSAPQLVQTTPMVIAPPAWGRLSFADMLREEAASRVHQ